MITRDSIEAAYCFFHQKHRVYVYSSDIRQREDIEYAVENYVDTMSAELYGLISNGNSHCLRDYANFQDDLEAVLHVLENLQEKYC